MTEEDEEFKRIERESGWRKRQIQTVVEDDDDIQDYKKPWVGLTDEEIHECFEECCNLKVVDPKGGVRGSVNIFDVGRAIESKLKARNT